MNVRQILKIPLTKILADDEFNCRGEINPIDVVDLAKDIELHGGLIQPVIVMSLDSERKKKYPEKDYLLIVGYRRFISHRDILNWNNIEAVIEEKFTTELEARLANLSENLQRKNLDILQEAKAIKKLRMLGISRDEVAKRMGMSMGWVQIRFMLLDLPEEAQIEAKIGIIGQQDIRDLYSILRISGKDSCIKHIKKVKEDRLLGNKRRIKPRKDIKRHRSRGEIFEKLAKLQETFPNGFWSRVLAWAAGEIRDTELDDFVVEYAKKLGLVYKK